MWFFVICVGFFFMDVFDVFLLFSECVILIIRLVNYYNWIIYMFDKYVCKERLVYIYSGKVFVIYYL